MNFTHKIIEQTTQADGVQRLHVAFFDEYKLAHNRHFDFPKGTDVEKSIEAIKPNIENGLIEQEVHTVCNIIESGGRIPVLKYATTERVKIAFTEQETIYRTEIADKTVKADILSVEAK